MSGDIIKASSNTILSHETAETIARLRRINASSYAASVAIFPELVCLGGSFVESAEGITTFAGAAGDPDQERTRAWLDQQNREIAAAFPEANTYLIGLLES